MNIDRDFAIIEFNADEHYLFTHHSQFRSDALKVANDLSDETDRCVSIFAGGKEIGTYDATKGEFEPATEATA